MAEADLSTVSTASDRLVIVDASRPYGLLTEFQGNHDPEFAQRLLEYAVLAGNRLRVPIVAVAVLLRPFDSHAALRGRYTIQGPDDEELIDFRYRTLRVWQMPAEAFLAGGLAVLPLASIAKVRRAELPRILDRITERLESEATPGQADLLRTATFVLMGLKFDKAFVEKMMSRNVLELSSTYRALHDEAKAEGRAEGVAEGRAEGVAEGKAEEARRLILLLGAARWGEPAAATQTALATIRDMETLERIASRLLTAADWDTLLIPAE